MCHLTSLDHERWNQFKVAYAQSHVRGSDGALELQKKLSLRVPGKSVRGKPARIELDVIQSQSWPEKEVDEKGMWLW